MQRHGGHKWEHAILMGDLHRDMYTKHGQTEQVRNSVNKQHIQFGSQPKNCHYSPVGVLLVLDVQVFERGDEGLSLEASGGSCGNRRVADGALCANGGDVAPQWRSEVARLVPGLSHTADVEAAAEINTVQDLRQQRD